MRRKSLIVGAIGPFSGPWVNLEEGQWTLDGSLPPFVMIEDVIGLSYEEGRLIIGPNRVRAIIGVEVRNPIYLQVKRIA